MVNLVRLYFSSHYFCWNPIIYSRNGIYTLDPYIVFVIDRYFYYSLNLILGPYLSVYLISYFFFWFCLIYCMTGGYVEFFFIILLYYYFWRTIGYVVRLYETIISYYGGSIRIGFWVWNFIALFWSFISFEIIFIASFIYLICKERFRIIAIILFFILAGIFSC